MIPIEGRAWRARSPPIMTGHAYEQSREIAAAMGAVQGLSRCPLRARVQAGGQGQRRIHARRHQTASRRRGRDSAEPGVQLSERRSRAAAGIARWNAARKHGYRNAQVTVLAPTGTIAFLMDCDTTGVEPDIALVKYKLLAGGGMLKIVNRTVPEALATPRLQRGGDRTHHRAHREIRHDRRRGRERRRPSRSGLKPEHLPSLRLRLQAVSRQAQHPIHGASENDGARRSRSSAAPFPRPSTCRSECTVEDIRDAYVQAWKMGLKCVAIYRDGSKRSQPLNTKKTNEGGDKADDATARDRKQLDSASRNWKTKSPNCASKPASRCAAACPTPARASPTSSISPVTKVISPSVCSKTASPANCSSPWRRKVPPSAA